MKELVQIGGVLSMSQLIARRTKLKFVLGREAWLGDCQGWGGSCLSSLLGLSLGSHLVRNYLQLGEASIWGVIYPRFNRVALQLMGLLDRLVGSGHAF